jgi:NAD(P)-dependent dehydrogenase (short-subunit alcohol dehydrogenase family)
MSGLTELDGRVAVVTGGASGIGFGIAKQLRAQGAKLVIADIEQGALDRAAKELGALPVKTDVSDPASIENLAAKALAEFGAVHVVCNNAGVGAMSMIADSTLADWRWMIDVNLYGVIHGIHTFLPILKRNADGGHFVNTSSLGGLSTMAGLGIYAVTKYGVVALSEVLAQELTAEGSKVGVTVLCPGTIQTNIKASSRNRPSGLGPGGLQDVDLEETEFGSLVRWASPEEVGDIVVRAIQRGDLYAFTHPDMKQPIIDRHVAISEAFDRAHQELGV